MARKLASALMVALMGAPPSITALGLGKLDSDSALNEPLSARIPLLSIQDADAASVRVSLAPPAAFERAGLDRPFYLSRLKFEVKQRDGEHYILISTEKPVKEPFLDFLLEVRWPQGNLQREYTVLLDPPLYAAGKPSGPVQNGRAISTQTRLQNDASTPSSTEVAIAGERGIGERGASGLTRYGPVQANQTLWSIASEVRPYDGVTVYQTMQAILLANPGAFVDGNINAMMKGSVLRVPSREEIARIGASEATLRMQEQLTRWQSKHLSGGPEAPPAQTSAQTTAVGPDKEGGAQAAPASATSPSTGRLHVVAARDGAGAQAMASLADQVLAPTQQNISRLQHQLALVVKRNVNLKSANARLQQQASSLKKELIDLKSIVNLQLDEDVALPVAEAVADRAGGSSTAQRQGAAGDSRSEATLASASELPPSSHLETTESGPTGQHDLMNKVATTEAPQSGPIAAMNPASGSQPTAAAIPPKAEAHSKLAGPPVHASAHEAQSSAAAANPQASPTLQQQASPSLKSRLLAYLPQGAQRVVLLVSSLLLVLLLLLWTVRRRRGTATPPRKLPPEAPAPITGQALATVTPDNTAANLGRADAQPQAATAVDESALLDQAETHIAYGHYDQAQALLDHALGEHPDSQELRLKLLEVLAAQGDRNGFEAEAQVLHTQVADESDSHWQRTIQLARYIAPDHPLFSDAMTLDSETTAVQPPKSVNTAAADAVESADTPMPQALEAEFDLSLETLALDQSGNLGEEDLYPADGRQESAVLEFDLGDVEAFASQQKEKAAFASSGGSGDDKDDDDLGSLDFSLPEDWAAPPERMKGNGSDSDRDALQPSDFSSQNELDTEGTTAAETDDSVGLDEVGTKLDLARAYLDMGDAAGARSLLEEVVTEGNPAQQGEAQELLRQVG